MQRNLIRLNSYLRACSLASANPGPIVPRYFFDTDDGERQIRDENGIDLSSINDIGPTTRDLLFDLGHAEVLEGRDRVFTAVVRDDRGDIIYRGSMVLRIDLVRPDAKA